METLTTLLLILISTLISLYGSIVGFGGGVFVIPLLITFFGFDFSHAVGTTMISLVPSAFISTYLNRKNKNVDFKIGTLLELPTMLGVVLGSLIISYVAVDSLKIIFIVLMVFVGLSFFFKVKRQSNNNIFVKLNELKPNFTIKNELHSITYKASLQMLLLFGISAGTVAGMFGMGGGFLKTPIMIKVFKIPAKISAATALFMIMVTSITGSVSHYLQGHIDFRLAFPVMLGFTIGAIVGHRINTHIKQELLEKLIGAALLLASCVMFINLIQ